MTSIEWTDETWNPTVGCSRVSPGCDSCYAIRVAAREMQEAHVGLTVRTTVMGDDRWETSPKLDWTGEVRLLPDRLDIPLRWRKPRRVFVDSMSDLFHPDIRVDFLRRVFDVMTEADQHTFQVLTKRPQRMASILREADAATSPKITSPPNVWLGTSVENQRYANLRIPHLLATPAAVRFLSIEPLLGPIDLTDWLWHYDGAGLKWPRRDDGIDWVIVGGESGPGARPMHPDWVRSIRDQCVAAGVPFFFKQWGEWLPLSMREHLDLPESQREWRRYDTGESTSMEQTYPEHVDRVAVRVGKKTAGRELDGLTWDEMPA